MSEHSGPSHDRECLALFAAEAACRCLRRDWLREMVPRHQARAELLTQLAGWAREQGIFAEHDVSREKPLPETGAPAWAWHAVRQAAAMAREIYIGVRMRALSMHKECEAAAQVPEKAKPAERPVETAKVQETLL